MVVEVYYLNELVIYQVIIHIDSLITDSIYVNIYFNDDYILESKLWV